MTIWHPFTQKNTSNAPLKIVKGDGVYLYSENGKRYIDMISSWWVNLFGHSNKEISEAIYEQAQTLEHVIFAGFTHEPAEKLTRNLKNLLPDVLDCFFFSDNGSTAVEVALKMAFQYFKNQGIENRKIFINLEGAYHGDTLGAMSASGKTSSFHSVYSELFFDTFSVIVPEVYDDVKNIEEKENESLNCLKKFLEEKGNQVCALIVEPLIQGAAGMRMFRAAFLEQIVNIVRQHGILVIFDEVMTGFFRTGSMFAFEQTTVIPDFLCISKGITGGFMPLALTVTTHNVYNQFCSSDFKKTFLHGHSYTANPIACSAAIKNLEILQRKEIQANIKNINKIYNEYSNSIKYVSKKRTKGTITAFNVSSNCVAKKIQQNLLKHGIIIRPLGTSVYLIPPFCISEENLKFVFQTLKHTIQPSYTG